MAKLTNYPTARVDMFWKRVKHMPLLCFQEMHLEDATRFCPKEERESEQTSFSDQNPRQDQKGGFRSSFRKLFKKK